VDLLEASGLELGAFDLGKALIRILPKWMMFISSV
jgi:hypothetical protein